MTSEEGFWEKWVRAFARDVPKKQIKEQMIPENGGFLWHAFSWKLVPCLKGDAARAEYNNISKNGAVECMYFPQNRTYRRKAGHGNPAPLNDNHMTAEQIDNEGLMEFYVIGKNYLWCYVCTHEYECGPYFCYARETDRRRPRASRP